MVTVVMIHMVSCLVGLFFPIYFLAKEDLKSGAGQSEGTCPGKKSFSDIRRIINFYINVFLEDVHCID